MQFCSACETSHFICRISASLVIASDSYSSQILLNEIFIGDGLRGMRLSCSLNWSCGCDRWNSTCWWWRPGTFVKNGDLVNSDQQVWGSRRWWLGHESVVCQVNGYAWFDHLSILRKRAIKNNSVEWPSRYHYVVLSNFTTDIMSND